MGLGTARNWHAAAVLVIGALTLILALVADRATGHERLRLGTIADRVYTTDGWFAPEQNGPLGTYRWSEPLAKLTLWGWGPGPIHLRVTGFAAGDQPQDVTLKLGEQTLGHTVVPPGQPWTVEGTGQTTERDPLFTLEGPRLDISGDNRLLGRVVTEMEIDSPAARDRALLNLGLLALAGLLLYVGVFRWAGQPGLALLAGAALPAAFGLFAVYRDRWLDTLAWTAPLALGVALLLDARVRPPSRLRRLGTGAAVIALGAALLLLAQGVSNAFDSDLMYRMAAGWVEYGQPTKYPSHSWSKYGFGLPLAAVPFYGLGKAALVFGGDRQLLTTFTVSLTNLVITALLAWVLYRAERRFMSAPIALAGVATFLLATPALNYARTFFSEPLGALLLLLGLLLLVPRPGERQPTLGRVLLAGGCLGAMILIKPAFAVYLPVPGLLVLGLAVLAARQGRLSPLAQIGRIAGAGGAFAVGPLVALAGQLAYSYVRYGNWLGNGYEKEEGFSTPLLAGLGGLLFSPGKSLFLYAPVVLLTVPACWLLARRGGQAGRVAVLLIAGETVAGLGLNALWWAWTGNFAWGPRLIVPLLPLLIWPLGALVDGPARIVAARWRQGVAAAWVVLGVLGALVSIPGALVDFQVYYGLRGLELAGQAGEAPTIYDPAQSPLLVESGYLLDGLTAAIHRPTLAETGLPPGWDTLVPALLTVVAVFALWIAARQRASVAPVASLHPGDPPPAPRPASVQSRATQADKPSPSRTAGWQRDWLLALAIMVVGALVLLGHLLAPSEPAGADPSYNVSWGLSYYSRLPVLLQLAGALGGGGAILWALFAPARPYRGADNRRVVDAPRAALFWKWFPWIVALAGMILFILVPVAYSEGDSALVDILILKGSIWAESEPLDFYLKVKLYQALRSVLVLLPSGAFQIAAVLAGGLYILAAVAVGRTLGRTRSAALLLAGGMAGVANVLFFFRYVETYAFVTALSLLLLGACWRYSEGKLRFELVAALFAVAILFHGAAFCWGPMVLVAWLIRAYRRESVRRWSGALVEAGRGLIVIMAVFALVIGTFFLDGYPLSHFQTKIGQVGVGGFGGGDHQLFVPLFTAEGPFQHYTFFSWSHLGAIVQEQLLTAPMALPTIVLVLVLAGARVRALIREQPAVLALVVGALSALAFSILWNPDLGPRADWDLLALPSIPLTLLAVYLLVQLAPGRPKRVALAAYLSVSVVHTGAWVLLHNLGLHY